VFQRVDEARKRVRQKKYKIEKHKIAEVAQVKPSEKSPLTHTRTRMREIQRWKVGVYNYGRRGRRRRRTVWHVMVGGERELALWHSGPAIQCLQALCTARASKQPHDVRANIHYCGQG
jgi:hypothetical protein